MTAVHAVDAVDADTTNRLRKLSDPHARIHAIDALRGFALCGILLINIYQTLHLEQPPVWIRPIFLERFFTIFSLLFGIGFGMFLSGSAAKTEHPRLLLLRRLAVLGGFGALHIILQPGEVLWMYGVGGLVVLLPLSYLSRRAVAVIAIVLLLGGMLTVGAVALLPGLFASGLALSRYEVPRTLPQRTGLLAVLFVVFSALTALAAWVVTATDARSFGLGLVPTLQAFAYACGFLLLCRTPLARPLEAALALLGRMALTNYLTQTVLFVILGSLLGLEGSTRWGTAIGLTVGILVVQAVWSSLWLAANRYGPLEWLWRCATWARWVPLREREASVAAVVA